MIFFSMALFALVQNRMLNYKEQSSHENQLEEISLEMELYLARIDMVKTHHKLEHIIYDDALRYMIRSY